MEFIVGFIVCFIIAAGALALHIMGAIANYFADETTEKTYWERVMNSRTYSALRNIYHKPHNINRIPRYKLNKYLTILMRSISPLDIDTYTKLVNLLLSSRKVSRRKLIWLWENSMHNLIIKEAVSRHPKLPEEKRAFYAMQLISNTAF